MTENRGFKVIYEFKLLKRAIRFGRQEKVLYVSPDEQTVLNIEYIQGRFIVESALGETPHPSVLIAAAS